jgi:alpha-tubulin suppressor-like RCC1 family protein
MRAGAGPIAFGWMLGVVVAGCCGSQSDGTKSWPGPFLEVAAQRDSTCALDSTGVVQCWGTGSVAKDPLPSAPLKKIAMGGNCGVGVRLDDTLVGWGNGCEPPPSGSYLDIGVGHEGCAINRDRDLICWALSGATKAPVDGGAPIRLPPRRNTNTPGPFTTLSMGSLHGCALRADGTIHCWGNCSATNAGSKDCPARIAPPSGPFVDVASGDDFSCVLGRDHRVQCWGELGALAPPATSSFAWSKLAAKHNTLCGVNVAGEVECAGEPVNWNGTHYRPPPGPFVNVAVGGRHVCAIRPAGVLECWRVDQQGQVSGKPPWPRT